MGDIVYIKNPQRRCKTKFRKDCITQVNSPHSVQIDGILYTVKDLHQFFGLKPFVGVYGGCVNFWSVGWY